MTAPKRFFSVMSPAGNLVHRMFANNTAEGNKTTCGILVRAGWLFWNTDKKTKVKCKRCWR